MNLSKHFFRYIIISILFVILFCFIKPTVKEKFSLFDSNIDYTFLNKKNTSTKTYEAGMPLPKNELDLFYKNLFLGECCFDPNIYSSSAGCACLSTKQKKIFEERGGNNK